MTAARIIFSALPPPWSSSVGDTLLEFSVDGEARLMGDTFAAAPLRTEVWAKGAISAARSLGWVDQLLLGASLEATLSAPGDGRIWPIPIVVAGLSWGQVSLRSETTIALEPSVRIDAERVSVQSSWGDLGISAEGAVEFSAEPKGMSVEFRFLYEFGDTPLRRISSDSGCAGGVCR